MLLLARYAHSTAMMEHLNQNKFPTELMHGVWKTWNCQPGSFFKYLSPAKFWPRSPRDLAENLGEFLAAKNSKISKSRRDSHQDLGEISKSQRLKTHRESCRDLKILSRFSPRSGRDLRISAAKNSPRFSPRSQNLGSQELAEISKSRRPKTHRESRQDFK